jgi:hypothetical protein
MDRRPPDIEQRLAAAQARRDEEARWRRERAPKLHELVVRVNDFDREMLDALRGKKPASTYVRELIREQIEQQESTTSSVPTARARARKLKIHRDLAANSGDST